MFLLTIGWALLSVAAAPALEAAAPVKKKRQPPAMNFVPRAEFEKNFALFTARVRGGGPSRVAPEMRVEESRKFDGYTRQLVSYNTEADERVEGYLLIPDGLAPGEKRALMLCLHGTNVYGKDLAADELSGYPPMPEEALAQRRKVMHAVNLARLGFVCFVPDRPGYGKRCPDQPATGIPGMRKYIEILKKKHPGWDYLHGKVVHDLQQALDFLTELEFVDAEKIGAMGHSLGGRDCIEIAAFDDRVKAVVISCSGNLHYREELWTDAEAQREFIGGERVLALGDHLNLFWQAIAPRPFLVIMAFNDTSSDFARNGIDGSRPMKMYYDFLYGDPARLKETAAFAMLIHSAGHSMPTEVRDFAYHWLLRTLEQAE